LVDGKPEGYWKSYYRNGELKAEGNRKDFLLDGTWIFYDRDGEKTTSIQYVAGKKEGVRKSFKKGTLVKQEPFVNDLQEGYARYFYLEDGSLKQEVPFKAGKEEGTGYQYSKDGRIITLLTYKNGALTRKQSINQIDGQKQKQGLWMAFYPNRNPKFEGPYLNDLKNGYWKYYRANGDLLRVEKWVNGELQENAQEVAKVEIKREIHPETGELSFKGAFRNGLATGVHREYDKEGKVIASKIYEDGKLLYEGIVDEAGRKQGPWKHYYSSGELKAEGSYRDDKKVGPWKYYFRDGNLEQTGSYLSGKADGTWIWYFPNGEILREEEYVFGEEDGLSTEYSDSGKVIARGTYVSGYKEGEWFFEVNDHREEGSYFEGLRTGLWKHYYLSNGQLRFEGSYENGQASGAHSYYFPNGQLKRRGKYLAGERDGLWEFFAENGARIITIEYEDGEEIKYNGEKINYGRRYERAMAEEAAQNDIEDSE
jgi:antitoxin component YwqK of YwqJK toxin-antitoxin module